ncbi:MAG: hypothetical protein HZY78_04270 [Burkholderiaceae bacterium]|nr:MAG: hypothetical protein HZY78_04270 [Burkholderiaceae bacterium]
MAEFTTIFIPTDKSFVPSDQTIEEAVSFLDGVYRGDYPIETKTHSVPRFIDSGADFDRFSCPACKAVVKAYDYSDWWYTGPLQSIQNENQLIKVPCCHAELQFNQFDFGKHVGFAQFQINVEYAGEDVAPNDQQLHQLEAILGCSVRRIVYVMD